VKFTLTGTVTYLLSNQKFSEACEIGPIGPKLPVVHEDKTVVGPRASSTTSSLSFEHFFLFFFSFKFSVEFGALDLTKQFRRTANGPEAGLGLLGGPMNFG
jgi:hypothetical protein